MLNRFRTPEIVLGALFGAALMAGIWGWTDSYAPTERQRQECYEAAKQAHQKSDECKTFWERTTSDPIAFFTLVLAFSTIGLWIVTGGLYLAGERQINLNAIAFRRQAVAMTDSNETARQAANAADLGAKAAIALQLPIIRLRIDSLGHGVPQQGQKTIESCDVNSITVFNLGRQRPFRKKLFMDGRLVTRCPISVVILSRSGFRPIASLKEKGNPSFCGLMEYIY
jgi:hypothetical protein